MRLLHDLAKTHVAFEDRNLVSRAGLVPVMGLAARCGLAGLVARHVRIARPGGVNAGVKVGCVVAGMAAGADSIDDLGVLRHGTMGVVFGGVRAPSTLGTFLRSFTWGNARQLEAVHRRFLAGLARAAPLLPGKDVVAFVDVDSCQKRVFGYHKQGAAFGYTKISGKSLLVGGLNVLAATISTPRAAPVTAAVRLRGGSAGSARGAASFITEAVGTARDAGCTGTIVVRMDSAFYSSAAVWAVRRAGACFSVTAQLNASVKAAIAAIGAGAWTPIGYPRALWDDQLGCWVSDAEVAEVPYTAFTSWPHHGGSPAPLPARLIVRRVRDKNTHAPAGQAELFPAWRYHAVFTDSPFETITAEEHHRGHAIIEQAFADFNDGPLAHLPSGSFPANAAWLACAAITTNLLRAAAALAGATCANARGATIRRDLVNIAARTARHGRGHLTLHLPQGWHRHQEWLNLFRAACRPPPAAPA
jgi:hypothetical protein